MQIGSLTLPTDVAIADGAWGTMLQARGAAAGELVDDWNLTRPHDVAAVARAYVEAGAQIILTNTFRSNRFVLGRHGLAEKVHAINAAGGAISRDASAGKARVFGSIGPSGKLLMRHEVSESELTEAFAAQAAGLAAGGVDAILLETFFDLNEIRLALRAVRRATGLPAIASMTFDSGADRTQTMMGVTPERAAQTLTEAGAAAVGCNCGAGVDGYVRVVELMRQHTNLPIWAKPNAGLPEVRGEGIVYGETPAGFAAGVTRLICAGAQIVGGCCGTTPEFIRAIAQLMCVQNGEKQSSA